MAAKTKTSRVEKVRVKHGLTVAQIAGAADVNEKTVRNACSGARPSTSTARHLSRAFRALTGETYTAEWLRGGVR